MIIMDQEQSEKQVEAVRAAGKLIDAVRRAFPTASDAVVQKWAYAYVDQVLEYRQGATPNE